MNVSNAPLGSTLESVYQPRLPSSITTIIGSPSTYRSRLVRRVQAVWSSDR